MLTSEVKFALKHGADKQLYYTMEFGKHKATVSYDRMKRLRDVWVERVSVVCVWVGGGSGGDGPCKYLQRTQDIVTT